MKLRCSVFCKIEMSKYRNRYPEPFFSWGFGFDGEETDLRRGQTLSLVSVLVPVEVVIHWISERGATCHFCNGGKLVCATGSVGLSSTPRTESLDKSGKRSSGGDGDGLSSSHFESLPSEHVGPLRRRNIFLLPSYSLEYLGYSQEFGLCPPLLSSRGPLERSREAPDVQVPILENQNHYP